MHFCIQKAVLGHLILKSDMCMCSATENKCLFVFVSAVRVLCVSGMCCERRSCSAVLAVEFVLFCFVELPRFALVLCSFVLLFDEYSLHSNINMLYVILL